MTTPDFVSFDICALAASMAVSGASLANTRPLPFTTEAERCVVPASLHHGVNFHVLRAILVVESRLNPATVSRNTNRTVDVGVAGINSIHFSELARHGIAPNDLLDACVSTYVAAWKLRHAVFRHGNTWFGVAAYHSTTPKFNKRYQALLQNELIRTGQLSGPIQHVPSLSQISGVRQAPVQPPPPTLVTDGANHEH